MNIFAGCLRVFRRVYVRVGGSIRLARPGNVLVCALSVLSGGLLAGKPCDMLGEVLASCMSGSSPGWFVRVLSAAASASLILAAGNIHNDICDLAADRVNAPGRPLPSGDVGGKAAALLAAALSLAGLLLSLPLGPPGIGIACGAVLLLTFYNIRLKGIPLAGNLAVAILGGVAFIYGGIAGGAVREACIPALFAFLFHLGREIIKDAADARGDHAAGLQTVATMWGAGTAVWGAVFVFVLLGAATSLPYVWGRFGPGYILLIAGGVWPVLAYAAASSLLHPTESTLRRVASILKLDMPAGILAVLAGFQGW